MQYPTVAQHAKETEEERQVVPIDSCSTADAGASELALSARRMVVS